MSVLELSLLLLAEITRTACSLPWGTITIMGNITQLGPYTALVFTQDNCYVEVLLPSTFYDELCKPTVIALSEGIDIIVRGVKYPSPSGNVIIPEIVNVNGETYYTSLDQCVAHLRSTTCTVTQ